jgi:flagellum-specific ATP synthase
MPMITTPEQQQLIRRFRALNAAYAQNRDLITIGAYAKGSDPRVDEAIQYWPQIQRFLQQDGNESISFAQSFAALKGLFATERPREVKQ